MLVADLRESLNEQELENLLLLRGVELESVLGLLEDCPVQELNRGEVLIRKGGPNHFLYLLLSGRLRIHLKLTLDPIVVLESGEVVGELSLIDGQPTSAYVVADENCRLLVLDEKTMWSLFDSCPKVALNLLFVLARRLRHGDSLILRSQQLQREYARYAVLDALTGLYNGRWLDNVLPRQIERCKKGDLALSLLRMRIDRFKSYKNIQGPLAGDRALYTVAWTLRKTLRPGEMIARYREDEFIVLLPDTDASTSQKLGERLREKVAETKVYSLDRSPLPPVTISVGVAQMTAEDTPEAFVGAANQALGDAKESGGNRVFKADRPS
ncbi:GGDEF domain-containing protein [Acidobacteria bacterium AH-259-L09]|nr:GGDEF domain-containing protein [Acidobacteria bacterium AH-259-L09]